MKIVYHHRTQGRGAEGVHIREVVKAWRKMGHEVFVVSPPGIDVFKDESKENIGLKSGFLARFWAIFSRYVPQIVFEIMEIFYNFSARRKISKIVDAEKIDFIYERYAFFCWAGVKCAKRNGIPIILEVNEISGIKRVRGQILKNIAKKIEVNNFKQASVIVVVSEFLKQKIAEEGVSSEKIQVVPNGVNPEVFSPDVDASGIIAKYNLVGKVVIGFVGGFVEWHNFELLFESFKEASAHSSKNLCLLLLGDGHLRKELESNVLSLNIANKVIFAGKVSHEEVPAYIKAMDVCVIPQSNEFRSPIKLFEYMIMGKPVVAPKLPPIQMVVKENIEAVLFNSKGRNELAEKISLLSDDEELRSKIGLKAREKVMRYYLWENNADIILNKFVQITNLK